MVTDLITHMVTTQVVDHTTVDRNPALIDRVTILIDMRDTQLGEQVVTDHSTVTEVLVVDKVW